jgi:hypothetical protein
MPRLRKEFSSSADRIAAIRETRVTTIAEATFALSGSQSIGE